MDQNVTNEETEQVVSDLSTEAVLERTESVLETIQNNEYEQTSEEEPMNTSKGGDDSSKETESDKMKRSIEIDNDSENETDETEEEKDNEENVKNSEHNEDHPEEDLLLVNTVFKFTRLIFYHFVTYLCKRSLIYLTI